MIKGKIKADFTSVDEILAKTNFGYDIYRYHLGRVSRIMNRPWGHKEKQPSWGVFFANGTWMWRDFANEQTGNAVTFIQKMFSLSPVDALNKICWDFGLGGKQIKNIKPVKIDWEAPIEEEKEYCEIDVIDQPFKEEHHKFWNQAEIPEEHCRKMNCFAIKSLAINKDRVAIKRNEPVFGFYAPEEKGWKIYFPCREKGKKFRNNISYFYLWNYNNLESCDSLIVQKSPKDMIVTAIINPCVIATQAEGVKIFNSETVEKINKITKNPVIWYGSDWDGVKKCKEITDTNKWKYVNTPKTLLPEINDAFGYASKFGLKGLEDFMRIKKLIK